MAGSFITFQKTIGTDITQIVSSTEFDPTSGLVPETLVVNALAANTGKVFLGDDAVTVSTGLQLDAGDIMPIDLINAHELYAVGSNVNDAISVMVLFTS